MTIVETVILAFSMYSALPMPQIAWNERNMRYALCAFPLVGVVQGLVCGMWVWCAQTFGLPAVLKGAGLCVLPVLVNGGIHLDGYTDTCDALASHASPERKQEILKDPHIGSFAMIRLCCYFLAQFALWTGLPHYDPGQVGAVFCLSRVLSALAVATFPLAKNTGLAYTFATAAHKKRVAVMLVIAAGALAVLLCFGGSSGICCTVAAAAVMLWYHHMATGQFGGISGDLAGWFLQTVELWMLAAICFSQYVEASL